MRLIGDLPPRVGGRLFIEESVYRLRATIFPLWRSEVGYPPDDHRILDRHPHEKYYVLVFLIEYVAHTALPYKVYPHAHSLLAESPTVSRGSDHIAQLSVSGSDTLRLLVC